MFKRTYLLTSLVLIVIFTSSLYAAETIDWQRYCIDGMLLSGNHGVRYRATDPIPVTVVGKTQYEADTLVDEEYGSGISWSSGQQANITIDLGAQRHISGIVVQRGGNASWTMSTSTDGISWTIIPSGRYVDIAGNSHSVTAAANFAHNGRYVKILGTAIGGLSILDIYIYGQDNPETDTIGNVYTSWAPPVANELVDLRNVVRNFSGSTATNVNVDFYELLPGSGLLGSASLGTIEAGCAKVASIEWTPTETEPHLIGIAVSCTGLIAQSDTRTVNVVNRVMYSSGFDPLDNRALVYYNLYTTTNAMEYYQTKLRGGKGLLAGGGPHGAEQSYSVYYNNWVSYLSTVLNDGFAMDEWGNLYASACLALQDVYDHPSKGNKIIAPWSIGSANGSGSCFDATDLVFEEMYLNIYSHYTYRSRMNDSFNQAAAEGLTDKWMMSLGIQTLQMSSSAHELEREVKHIRFKQPDSPGMSFYNRPPSILSKTVDSYFYKYFIAPAVALDGIPQVVGSTVDVPLKNIGGMNAYVIDVNVYSHDGQTLLGSDTLSFLAAGGTDTLSITMSSAESAPSVKICESDNYTAMNFKAIEVIPNRQTPGGPLMVEWTLPSAGILASGDKLQFVNSFGSVVYEQSTSTAWDNYYVHGIPAPTTVGDYTVRLYDISAGKVIAYDEFTVLESLGDFWATGPGGSRLQTITIEAGDEFEINWDFPEQISEPVICISNPTETMPDSQLRQPRPNRSYSIARMGRLEKYITRAWDDNFFQKGSFMWESNFDSADLDWLNTNTDDNPLYEMHLTPGQWRLWFSSEHRTTSPKWMNPSSDVLYVNVLPADPYDPGDIDEDGEFNFDDFVILARNWQRGDCSYPSFCEGADTDKDYDVDYDDLDALAGRWLRPNIPIDGPVNPEDFERYSTTSDWLPTEQDEGWTFEFIGGGGYMYQEILAGAGYDGTQALKVWAHDSGNGYGEWGSKLNIAANPIQTITAPFKIVAVAPGGQARFGIQLAGQNGDALSFYIQSNPSKIVDIKSTSGWENIPSGSSIQLDTWYNAQVELNYSSDTFRARYGPRSGSYYGWSPVRSLMDGTQYNFVEFIYNGEIHVDNVTLTVGTAP